jgi:hypothetical protein
MLDVLLPPTVSGVTVTAADNADSVATGGTLQFSAQVAGTNNPAQTVIWEITGDKHANTTISETGLLTVAAAETNTGLTIKATSTDDTSKSSTKTITVLIPSVSAVTVTAANNATSVARGATLQFSAQVAGTNNPAQTVTWEITGTKHAGTTISATGLLTVAAAETNTPLTIKATSTVDTSKSGTKTVSTHQPPELQGIAVTQNPNRTVYGLSETIDITGLVVTATYSDSTTAPCSVTTANLSRNTAHGTAGNGQSVTVTVNGKTAAFSINVYNVVSKSSAGVYTGRADLNAAFGAAATGDTITIYNNQTITNNTNPNEKTVTLKGYGSERKITHTPGSMMFYLDGGNTTLILGDKITLDGEGNENGSDPLVYIEGGANFRMEAGSKITGGRSNDFNGTGGGGVKVYVGGTFTMTGGTISGNSNRWSGGGVYNSGTFIMSGGTISGNTAYGINSYYGNVTGNGGGVRNNGTFTMSGGATISGNTAGTQGGGVNSSGTSFTMSGGTISGNSSAQGGGLCLNGPFTYNNGNIISGNSANEGSQVYKGTYGSINGTGGVTVGTGANVLYNSFP